MRASFAPQRLRALAPLLRCPARRCGARTVASSGGGGETPFGDEERDEAADGGDSTGQRYSKLSAPPDDWAYGLHNPRRALGLRGVSLAMLRLRAGEARQVGLFCAFCAMRF